MPAAIGRNRPLALVVRDDVATVVDDAGGVEVVPVADLAAIDAAHEPRWVVWSTATSAALVAHGVRVAKCWDLAAVHRLLHGGWHAPVGSVWAAAHGLASSEVPSLAEPDLFTLAAEDEGDPEEPVRDDGHLRPDWADGAWSASDARAARWANLAHEVAQRQLAQLDALEHPARARRTAQAESSVELLCAELAADGLPVDRDVLEVMLVERIGPRPRDEHEAAAWRATRDHEVLRLVPAADDIDLRSPGQVRSLLRRAGIEVPDTRAWRLRQLRDAHPVVDALLVWRKDERIATTYGYSWIDEHLGNDDRLRGTWTGTDGAAGRMTASAGLHNLPADLRVAVVAEPGMTFVRADLGQVEPRVLAAVSGDGALASAAEADDLYLPVAQRLGIERAVAKVAVLGAMYGQTTGTGAQVLPQLEAAYPVAMTFLRDADRAAQGGRSLRTHGGRRIAFGPFDATAHDDRALRRIAAARGRYGRNAVVQGAAAELFKMWALTVRRQVAPLGASIVLCLHDELLVHAPDAHADEVATIVVDALHEAAHRFAPVQPVRFLADVSLVRCWADAKS